MNKQYIPERNHIIWLDFEPVKGKEIGKYRPTLVLSSRVYNQQTGLVMCCPISTSIRGHATEVSISNLDQPCVVAASIVQTYAWQERQAKFIALALPEVMSAVLSRLMPLLGVQECLAN